MFSEYWRARCRRDDPRLDGDGGDDFSAGVLGMSNSTSEAGVGGMMARIGGSDLSLGGVRWLESMLMLGCAIAGSGQRRSKLSGCVPVGSIRGACSGEMS